MLRNPNITEQTHLEKLPTFSNAVVDTVLADVNLKMSESVASVVKIIKDESLSREQKMVLTVKSICDCALTSGFGAGIMIASGVSPSNSEVQALDKKMERLVYFEEWSRSRIFGISRINKDTGGVDVRAEIPNWSKTVGAELPSWSDAKSRENLSVMIVSEIKKDLQLVRAFSKDHDASNKSQISEICSKLFHLEFLMGLIEGLIYAKRSDFNAMTHTYDTKDGKIGIPTFITALKGMLLKTDVSTPVGLAMAK